MKNIYILLLLFSITANSQTIGLTSFATGLDQITEVKNAGDQRLFVVQKSGAIKIVSSTGTINATPFLNISSLISTGSERGLLGLAFHPNYSTNGYFYVNYTNTAGNTVIARYSVSTTNPNIANSSSALILMTISQPFSNHNGGCINFGPDGYLWISMGDGGSGGDPQNLAQNKNSHLGKMLRIDVDGASPYAIPSNNPFQGSNEKAEIWYYGLRNAWKFSFDTLTNDVWIADVGQNNMEEINKVDYTVGGLNFGWKCYEGNNVYSSGAGCNVASNFTFPYVQYPQSTNGECSVTGGYVYRGTLYPNLYGKYIFADYCVAKIGMVDTNGTIIYSGNLSGRYYTTFGVDVNGEMYVASTNNNTLYKIIDTSQMNVETHKKKKLNLYPNPTKNEFTIETENNTFPLDVTIYDLTGKIIRTDVINHKTTQIPTHLWATGMYTVEIQNASGEKQIMKLLIE